MQGLSITLPREECTETATFRVLLLEFLVSASRPPWPDLVQVTQHISLLLSSSRGAHCIHLHTKCSLYVRDQKATRPPACKPLTVPQCGEKRRAPAAETWVQIQVYHVYDLE